MLLCGTIAVANWLTAARRLVRRADREAERYEASVSDQRGRNEMDWALSALICLWTVTQIGVLMHLLRIYPLF